MDTIFGTKYTPFFFVQVFGTFLTALALFAAKWIWAPPKVILLVLFMTLVNARYGYLVAKSLRQEKFNWKKFNKTFSIMVADLIIMAMIKHAIDFYPYYAFLADILFGWFFMNKLRQILQHMVLLRIQEQGFMQVVIRALQNFLSTKLGGEIVDSIQRPKKDKKEEMVTIEIKKKGLVDGIK